ncbi:MAG: cytochrome c oxidase subunit II [Hyphomicrobiales bacterium]|nr:MAG: cytochrome c oxidase subunit II [Hyphomicrobiales bacterium]
MIKGTAAAMAALAGVSAFAGASFAGMGQPSPKQMKFQDAATPIAEQVHWFHDYVTAIIVVITLFVLGLMIYTMWRFSEKRNPVPSKTSHNTTIEIIWTVVPVLILVAIAIPSFRLLYNQYTYPPPDVVIKATAHTWNWTHEYPDQKITIDSVMLQDSERAEVIKAGMPANQVPRNLAVDNEIVVPVNKVVHVLVTSSDVIHNWTIPSFASKVDAVPGRITATWFKPLKEGIFFGQCSELCGKDHAFMPIAVRVVKEQVYNDWVAALKARDRKKAKDIIKSAAIELDGAMKTAESGAIVNK